jgi:RNA polymerase sigma factor (sigma-70 family)
MPQLRSNAAIQNALADNPPLELLILRHINMVYSSALRQVAASRLAEDMTLAVFLILAQKQDLIRDSDLVGVWLHSVTKRASKEALHQQSVQERWVAGPARSQGAVRAGADWEKIAPVIDAALDKLAERDRAAIILPLFQNKSFAQTGAALGLSEEDARARHSRVVDKLCQILARQGVTVGSTRLSAAVGSFGIITAPAPVLADALTIARVGVVSGSVEALATSTLAAMSVAVANSSGALISSFPARFSSRREGVLMSARGRMY